MIVTRAYVARRLSQMKTTDRPHCVGGATAGRSVQDAERTTRERNLTSNELDATGHAADCARDEVGDAAAHEGRERHQKQEAASHAGHHRADPPLQAGDAAEGGVAAALLQHHRGLPLLVPHRVGAPPERAKGHGLAHLRAQQPIGHEEAHTGGGGAQQGKQGPDDPRARQAGRHGGGASGRAVHTGSLEGWLLQERSLCRGEPRKNQHSNTGRLHLLSDSGSLLGGRRAGCWLSKRGGKIHSRKPETRLASLLKQHQHSNSITRENGYDRVGLREYYSLADLQ